MKVNTNKSLVMKISNSRTRSFSPDIQIDGNYLKQISEMKNWGIIVQNNMKLNSNTANLCRKAYKKLWLIRKIKNLGISTQTLLEYYKTEIRVHLELVVPVWHSGLTIKLFADIEQDQCVAVSIMLGNIPYTHACELLWLEPLSTRRIGLCKRFALKTSRNS